MGTQTHWDLRIGNVPVCTRLGQGKSTKPLFSFLSFFSCNPGRLNIDLFCSCQGTAWTSFSNDTVTRFKSHKGMAFFLSPLLSSRLESYARVCSTWEEAYSSPHLTLLSGPSCGPSASCKGQARSCLFSSGVILSGTGRCALVRSVSRCPRAL